MSLCGFHWHSWCSTYVSVYYFSSYSGLQGVPVARSEVFSFSDVSTGWNYYILRVQLFWAIFLSFMTFQSFHFTCVSRMGYFLQITYGCFHLFFQSREGWLLCWEYRVSYFHHQNIVLNQCVSFCVSICMNLICQFEIMIQELINSELELQINVSLIWPLVPLASLSRAEYRITLWHFWWPMWANMTP